MQTILLGAGFYDAILLDLEALLLQLKDNPGCRRWMANATEARKGLFIFSPTRPGADVLLAKSDCSDMPIKPSDV
jgi:hypothetical protein